VGIEQNVLNKAQIGQKMRKRRRGRRRSPCSANKNDLNAKKKNSGLLTPSNPQGNPFGNSQIARQSLKTEGESIINTSRAIPTSLNIETRTNVKPRVKKLRHIVPLLSELSIPTRPAS